MIIADLLKEWKSKYKGEKDSDLKIKKEYLNWLTNNEWHVTYMAYIPASDESSYEKLDKPIDWYEKYRIKDNIKALMHPHFLEGSENALNTSEHEMREVTDRMNYELSRMKLLIQNGIDLLLVCELGRELMSNGLDEFVILLHQSKFKHMSEEIYLLIVELSNGNSKERAHSLLKSYLGSTIRLLDNYDSFYLGIAWLEYALSIINGEKEIDDCCAEVYENVFVKIQSRKCDYFSEYGKDCNELIEAIMLETGKMLTNLIEKDTTKTGDIPISIIYSPKIESSP